jgi:hypothetical protein
MHTPSHRYKDAQGTLYLNNSVTYDYAPVYAAAYIIQYSPILLCPSQDGNTNYTSAAGRSYTIVCAGYYDGGVDTGFTAASTLLNCILLCEGRSGCTGVVWTYGNEAETADPSATNPNGGCYFKSYGSTPIVQRRAGSQQAAAFVAGSSVPAVSSSTVSEYLVVLLIR